jgi:hypothetical protein
MTVGELKEALEDYGDHVEVYVRVFTDLPTEATFGDLTVEYVSGDVNGVVIFG